MIDEILQLEDARCRALRAQDGTALEGILDSGFVYVHGSGRAQPRAEYITDVVEGTSVLDDFEHLDTEVRVIGDCAIMTGELKHSKTDGAVTRQLWFRYSAVWSRESGDWRLLLWHNTKVAQPG